MSINIELDTIDTKLSIGMEKTIKAIVSPADASEKVVWSVNNENVLLTVNDKVYPAMTPDAASELIRELRGA